MGQRKTTDAKKDVSTSPEAIEVAARYAYPILDRLKPWDQAELLAMLLGQHLACLPRSIRKKIRLEIIRMVDEKTDESVQRVRAERKMTKTLGRRGVVVGQGQSLH